MSAIGSLVFCRDCGNLLDTSTGDVRTILTCECCGAQNKDTSSKTVITNTKASSFPSLLRQKRSAVQTVERSDMSKGALAPEPCPDCGSKEMRYYALQLRSADEGTTVFYECDTCGHKHTENN